MKRRCMPGILSRLNDARIFVDDNGWHRIEPPAFMMDVNDARRPRGLRRLIKPQLDVCDFACNGVDGCERPAGEASHCF